jgi:hypothetical protein
VERSTVKKFVLTEDEIASAIRKWLGVPDEASVEFRLKCEDEYWNDVKFQDAVVTYEVKD